jgi:hypothetical protein
VASCSGSSVYQFQSSSCFGFLECFTSRGSRDRFQQMRFRAANAKPIAAITPPSRPNCSLSASALACLRRHRISLATVAFRSSSSSSSWSVWSGRGLAIDRFGFLDKPQTTRRRYPFQVVPSWTQRSIDARLTEARCGRGVALMHWPGDCGGASGVS